MFGEHGKRLVRYGGARLATRGLILMMLLLLVACGRSEPDDEPPALLTIPAPPAGAVASPPTAEIPAKDVATALAWRSEGAEPTPAQPTAVIATVEPTIAPTQTSAAPVATLPIPPSAVPSAISSPTQPPAAAITPTRAVSPDVLLPSIAFGGMGAGDECPPELTGPQLYFSTTGFIAPSVIESRDLTIGDHVYFEGCGFPPLETAEYTFYLPDGSVVRGSVQIDETGYWQVKRWLMPGMPLGEYAFEFISPAGIFSDRFVLSAAMAPRITFECYPETMAILLVGFEPGEEVLLGRYTTAGGDNLAGYEVVAIGPDGAGMVVRPREDLTLIAVGRNPQPAEWMDADGNPVTFPASDWIEVLCPFEE
jgi:hypothetical protein